MGFRVEGVDAGALHALGFGSVPDSFAYWHSFAELTKTFHS